MRHKTTTITTRKKMALKIRNGVSDAPATTPTMIAPKPTNTEQNKRSFKRKDFLHVTVVQLLRVYNEALN
jgi:hypothetical protein